MAKSVLQDVKILLGVTGGIAAYKAADLASKLTAGGASVQAIMTESACNLIAPKTFEAVTGKQVFMSMWNAPEEFKIGHIDLATWADIAVVAPATANIIGKIANGICDDLLSTTLCACWQKPLLIAPAMNNNMWTNPAMQRNIKLLKETKIEIIGPEIGRLACGTEGIGRMNEPQDIIKKIEAMASKIDD